jgi:hypothetical protein
MIRRKRKHIRKSEKTENEKRKKGDLRKSTMIRKRKLLFENEGKEWRQ